jgi:hypothetical protein
MKQRSQEAELARLLKTSVDSVTLRHQRHMPGLYDLYHKKRETSLEIDKTLLLLRRKMSTREIAKIFKIKYPDFQMYCQHYADSGEKLSFNTFMTQSKIT